VKSRIISLTDYKNVSVSWQESLSCPQSILEKELRQVVRPYKKTEAVQILQNGDVAILKLDSACPRFQKNAVPVTIGGGLLDYALEEGCLGRSIGDRFIVETEQGSVTVTVLKATRTLYPAPTDDMVTQFCQTAEGYEGIKTVEAFLDKSRKDWQENRRSEAVFERMDVLMDTVLTTSRWEFDREEIMTLRQQNLDQLGREVNAPLEKMTGEELTRAFGVPDFAALEEEIDKGSRRWIAAILWCAAVSGKNPSLEDMADMNFDFLEAYVKENIIFEEDAP